MPSRAGLLSQLQLSDQDRGKPERPLAWSMWPRLVLVLVVAGAFGLGMWTQGARNAEKNPERDPASRARAAPASLTALGATADEAPKPSLSPATDTDDTDPAAAIALEATGYVVARQKATVSSQVEGLVTEVLVEEGDSVVAGQILARLDGELLTANLRLAESQLEATRAKLPELQVEVDAAEAASTRAEALLREHQISDAEAERARFALAAARAAYAQLRREVVVAENQLALQSEQLAHTEIRAPFAGVVINKAAQPGEIISPYSGGAGSSRTGICTIVDMSSVEIEVDVNESNVSRVHPGQRVTATLASWPDWAIPAEVITIVPTADRSRGTVRVRIELAERDSRILPDMAVRVVFANERTGETNHD